MNNKHMPQHIAIILDGNGRYATKNGKMRTYGHLKGAENISNILLSVCKLKIKYLTIYAFSTENWNRSKTEVKYLMNLIEKYLQKCLKFSKDNNIKVIVIGNRDRLDKKIINCIDKLEEATKDNTGLVFNIGLNYGSRDEIVRTFKKITNYVLNNKLSINEIDENIINKHLDTKGILSPDLLIRTGGEQRLSNFLLWQMAYTEFYFTNVFWPEFSEKDLLDAINSYKKRNRRFGGIKE